MKKLLPVSAALFLLIWATHLIIGTLALRGFFGDGSLAFLLNLSKSYVFNLPGHLIYLYGAHVPREGQFLLNSLGLQAALLLNIHNALVLKYIFNFWQFALPGFLYLLLFVMLARSGRLAWGIFPLLSWVILSAPVDWNAVNSSRWAVPIFWIHFLLVIGADKKINPPTALTVTTIGAFMLGGLYETIMLQAALTVTIGIVLWAREGNRTPLIYAAAAIPGAIRAAWSYFAQGGDQLPNGFHQLAIIYAFGDPYILFMLAVLMASLFLLFAKPRAQRVMIIPCALLLIAAGIYEMATSLPNIWLQVELRFDYLLISFALMALAGILRILNRIPSIETVTPSAHIILLSGVFIWMLQIIGTFAWQDCRAAYEDSKTGTTLVVAREFAPLFKPHVSAKAIPMMGYSQCLWDWAAPWEDLLTAPDGKIQQWEQFSFWQDFSFVTHDGETYLTSNNGTLVPPSVDPASISLPLKTLLYDLTPLYSQTGMGDLLPRTTCLPPTQSGDYWRDYLTKIDDKKRQMLFVCPRLSTTVPNNL